MSKVDNEAAEKALQSLNGSNNLVELDIHQARQNAAKRQLDEDLELDLEETLPQPVRVRIVEYKEVPLLDDEGQAVLDDEGQAMMRNEAKARIALIATHVPTELLTKVMAQKKKMESLEKLSAEESYEDIIKIYSDCVQKPLRLRSETLLVHHLSLLTLKLLRGNNRQGKQSQIMNTKKKMLSLILSS